MGMSEIMCSNCGAIGSDAYNTGWAISVKLGQVTNVRCQRCRGVLLALDPTKAFVLLTFEEDEVSDDDPRRIVGEGKLEQSEKEQAPDMEMSLWRASGYVPVNTE